jgi:hypothetical protein
MHSARRQQVAPRHDGSPARIRRTRQPGFSLRPIRSVRPGLGTTAFVLAPARTALSHRRHRDRPMGRRASRGARLLSPGAITLFACSARSLATASARAPASVGVIASSRMRSRGADHRGDRFYSPARVRRTIAKATQQSSGSGPDLSCGRRSDSPKLSGAVPPNRTSRATIAFLESDRPGGPRAGDAYGDGVITRPAGSGRLLGHVCDRRGASGSRASRYPRNHKAGRDCVGSRSPEIRHLRVGHRLSDRTAASSSLRAVPSAQGRSGSAPAG